MIDFLIGFLDTRWDDFQATVQTLPNVQALLTEEIPGKEKHVDHNYVQTQTSYIERLHIHIPG